MKLDQARDNENVSLKNIINQIVLDDWNPDVVVGIARGGLTPAVVVSHTLGIPMIPLTWSTRDYIARATDANAAIEGYKNVLIIDDITDSGLTMGEIQLVLGQEDQDIRYASMYLRHSSPVIPDYVGTHVNHDAWIEFSWEIQASELRN
jgi:hypoxanthine phosphoribosyltransferase